MGCRLAGLVSLGIAAILAENAAAQCSGPVSIAVTTTGASNQSCALDALTGRWNVNVTLSGSPTSNSTVTIRGGSTLMLGRVTIQNNTALDCRVNILGSEFDQRIGGVGFIDRGTSGANKVLLLQLDTNGDVGYDRPGAAAINVDMIYNLSVGGSVLGELVSLGTSRTMGNVYIQGDLTGGLSMGPTSSLDSIWVGGAFGRPNDPPARARVSGNILSLIAGSINADITTLFNSAAGTVHAIETVSGPFKGSLTCHRFGYMAGAPGNPRLNVAGDLDASITVTRDIRVPVYVTGSFTVARSTPGGSVPNAITTGTGAFDDPNADPAASWFIGGNLAGSMTLGTPLGAGLASINRNLTIGGALTGSLACAQDIGADIVVLGPGGIPGSMSIAGSLRSGRTIAAYGPLASNAMMSFGGSLLGACTFPAGGLQGQVVINARNAGGVWGGSISVGGANPFPSAPLYNSSSSEVGGGAVGLAPFSPNLQDCTPAHNSGSASGMVDPAAFTPGATPVRMRWYGPVEPAAGMSFAQAVAVEQLVGSLWLDRSPFLKVDGFPSGGGGMTRVVGLSRQPAAPGNPPVGQYRLRSVSLRCAGVTGSPSAIAPVPYLFRIDTDCDVNGQADSDQIAANPSLDQNLDGILDTCGGPPQTCPCDTNGSGTVSVQDLFEFLGQFFTNNPQADLNHSGGVTLQDVFDFLDCFFVPPAGC
ncbi:MAG: hypothetical protein IT438_13820 [Phycisphaerales bacterium]|nr:hypothetical protein [Phycisphaerales bacterium]